jgi:hypothetical protein
LAERGNGRYVCRITVAPRGVPLGDPATELNDGELVQTAACHVAVDGARWSASGTMAAKSWPAEEDPPSPRSMPDLSGTP